MSHDETGLSLPGYRLLSGPAYTGAFVERYNSLRPRPPSELFDLLVDMLPTRPPELVVDLGSGTGISTIPWSSRARQVIGVEVNPEMSRIAPTAANVEYRRASADATGLPDRCVDLITCGQSFHWMEPEPTIAEIARLLRPGGIFAAYDYDWPPAIDPVVDAAFVRVIEAGGVDPRRPEKAQHLTRLIESGVFWKVDEIELETQASADAEHISQLPLAFGPIARKLREGASPVELGLEALRRAIQRRLSRDTNVLAWRYRVIVARK